jgi:hypothetical protein
MADGELEPAPIDGKVISEGELAGIRLAEFLGVLGKEMNVRISADGTVTICAEEGSDG